MDVLDHSCSKLGFGGKMCIDGTAKTAEEEDARYQWTFPAKTAQLDNSLQIRFPEIRKSNSSLLAKGIPVLFIAVRKDRPNHIRELHEAISMMPELECVRLIAYVEHTVDATDLSTALWRFCNNLDPKRDHLITERQSTQHPGKVFACLGLDGTIKTAALDNFQRDWPNIIVADDETIQAVDDKWPDLGLGPFLSSPSLKFKDQLYGMEAVVKI
jgi:4-hydroxy-3-polyprenylbenzoate decarboxylase